MMRKINIILLCIITPVLLFSQTYDFLQSNYSSHGKYASYSGDALITLDRGAFDDRAVLAFDLIDFIPGASFQDYEAWEVGVRGNSDLRFSIAKDGRPTNTYTDILTLQYDETAGYGRVGLNTNQPSELLEIADGNNSLAFSDSQIDWKNLGTTHAQIASAFGNFIISNESTTFINSNTPKLEFQTQTSSGIKTQLRVDYSGDIGIGDDIGIVPAAVYLEHKFNPAVGELNNGHQYGVKIQNAASNNEYFTLYVADGGGGLNFFSNNSTNPVARILPGGAYFNLSDARYKKDIKPLGNTIDKINSITPRSYFFKSEDEESKRSIGFIAQELIKHFPEVVNHDVKADIYHVNYSALSTLAIKAIQEQQEHILSLEQKLEKQGEKIAEIMALLTVLSEKEKSN